MCGAITLNSVSRRRSLVGRVSMPRGADSNRDLYFPATTRIFRSSSNPAHTMISMRGWSFSIGRFLGVEIRVHTFFLLLLGLAISYSSVSGASGSRGFVLWLILFLAVLVREIARAVAAAWY